MQAIIKYFHPLVWIILSGTIFARTASFMAIPFLALYLHNQLNASPLLIGLTIGIAPLCSTFGGLIGGYLTDRFGRKIVIIITVFVWSLTFIGFAFAPTAIYFVFLNALNGFCRSFFEPGTQALMIDFTEDVKKRRLFSVRYTAINIAAVIGPLLGVWISNMSSASVPFIITGLMYATYGIFLIIILKRYEMKQQKLAAGNKIQAILNAVRKDQKLLYFITGGILISVGYAQFDSTLPQLIDLKVEDGVKLFSYVIVANSITVLTLQLPLTMLIEKIPIYTSLKIGITIFAVGLLLFGFSESAWMFIASMILFSIGEIFCFPTMNAVIEEIAPVDQKGIYLGAAQLKNIGGFIGPVLGGWLLVATVDWMYSIIAIIMFSSIFVYRKALRY
ncbi:MFS transporter [Lysinibacillus sp. 2017]|uniref:MDR family MFS transporter n=1 Tax=unclassified Lysinibacillus TaxID=2636778 RepID=UPI000D5280D5|nr:MULTISPECIES: MFS transporter [unclassified Lysinibacillus]AWE07113.1 MFS transporter [Lysinibacillus sp. 2017]TGN36968.1 MFS transporter [Lysinibacillus sp. S2017]